MARETKAQREARLELEEAQRLEVAKATYVERMMAVLNRAVNMNFELTVNPTSFLLTDRDERRPSPMFVSPEWNEAFADSRLYELEQAVEWKEEEAADRERVRMMRETALSKLTPEERTLLNL